MVVEARGEIFTIPAEKGDVRNLTNSSGSAERDPAWSPDGKWVSYFSDKSGEYKLVIESQDGLAPPREIALANPKHYYTPSWSPDSKKILFTDTNLKVWVLDVASGQAKVVGRDPWMVPQRTLNPVWSPDSKWVAYASRLNSLYRAIFVSNVETGETKQVTDGLADAMFPVWDASGKYLWFLASTNFGLGSQWLDMTSYDREETFGLYFAVLKKGEPSPLLPESDEDPGVGSAAAGWWRRPRRPGIGARRAGDSGEATDDQSAAAGRARAACAGDRPDRLRRPAAAHHLGARRAGTAVQPAQGGRRRHRLLPRGRGRRRRGGGAGGGAHPASLSPQRSARGAVRHRCRRVRRQRRRPQAALSHGWRCRRRADVAAPRRRRRVNLFLVDADRNPPPAGQGRLDVSLRMYLEPREEFKQIFAEGWRNQRDYLYVPNAHGCELAEDEGDVRRAAAVRQPPRRSQLPARQHGRRDRRRPLVRARRRHARRAAVAGRSARRRLRRRRRALQDHAHLRQRELESGSARAALGAGRRRLRRRLHRRDQRHRAAGARQHLPAARRHRQPADGARP